MTRLRTLFILLAALLPSLAAAGNSERNFGGIGIDGVPLADGRIQIRQLVYGGPAHRAGLRAGDIILSVDGKPTKGSDFRQMVDHRLRGRAGTPVLLTVKRPGSDSTLRVRMRRAQLTIPPAPRTP
jgi:C-terminal processing protease CtpA/Prc